MHQIPGSCNLRANFRSPALQYVLSAFCYLVIRACSIADRPSDKTGYTTRLNHLRECPQSLKSKIYRSALLTTSHKLRIHEERFGTFTRAGMRSIISSSAAMSCSLLALLKMARANPQDRISCWYKSSVRGD
jgi:hypothetical protein